MNQPKSKNLPDPNQRVADFTRSIPPTLSIVHDHTEKTLIRLATSAPRLWSIRESVAGGTDADREAGSQWVTPRFGMPIDPQRLILTNGTQGALLLLIEQFVGRDGLLLTEALTYTPLSKLASRAHFRLLGVDLDEDGIVPDAFAAICRKERPGALYCNPTIQNPTTSTMSIERRLAIAAIAREFSVPIIEDDPLGSLHPEAPPPIAALAPDITWCLMTTTKALAHGLRIAYLIAPSGEHIANFLAPVRALSHWFPNPLATAVLGDWIRSGAAAEISSVIAQELLERQTVALANLNNARVAAPHGAMHMWVRLPMEVDRATLVRELDDAGILVRPSEMFAVVAASAPNAIRLSLSSASDRTVVDRGTRILAERIAAAAAQ